MHDRNYMCRVSIFATKSLCDLDASPFSNHLNFGNSEQALHIRLNAFHVIARESQETCEKSENELNLGKVLEQGFLATQQKRMLQHTP